MRYENVTHSITDSNHAVEYSETYKIKKGGNEIKV
jgi:hypothetical protein